MDDERNFATPDDEINYWKDLAKAYKQSLEDCREELDEFQTSSRELEAELEAQLENAEAKTKELTATTQRLQMEVEMLRQKLENQQGQAHSTICQLEDELAQYKGFKDELQKYIRELEQSNDDLERAKRSTVVSLEDFEGRLNMAIERNAFLESELEERESLAITVQRLKDEARDLRQELQSRAGKLPGMAPVSAPVDNNNEERKERIERPKPELPILDSNRLADNNSNSDFVTPNTTPSKITSLHSAGSSTPLTPSARISALNIVGDLLRKVGALESKLASCRNFVKDQPRVPNKTGSSSPIHSPRPEQLRGGPRSLRAKRLHRGLGATGIPQPGQGAPQSYANVKIAV